MDGMDVITTSGVAGAATVVALEAAKEALGDRLSSRFARLLALTVGVAITAVIIEGGVIEDMEDAWTWGETIIYGMINGATAGGFYSFALKPAADRLASRNAGTLTSKTLTTAHRVDVEVNTTPAVIERPAAPEPPSLPDSRSTRGDY